MTRRTMIAVSAREWQGAQGRPHHFMRRCAAARWHVLYVEPPATLLAPLKRLTMLSRWRNWCAGLRRASPYVSLLAPPPILPFGSRYRWINRLNQRLIARSIRGALDRFAGSDVDLYAFLPNCVDLIRHLRCDRIVYDCVDDHAAFGGIASPDTIRQMERELAERADLCIASARVLQERLRAWTGRAHLIPNGCEYEHFATPALGDLLEAAPEIERIANRRADGCRAPIAGFIGAIGEWVDLELIASMARRLPNVEVVLVGPATVDISILDGVANLHVLGPREYRDLPAYLHHFEVALIPFRQSPLTAAVNPIKLFEYLAAGKPVVSTAIPEVEAFRGPVAVAEDADAFIAAVGEAVSAPLDPDAERLRREIASQCSWDARWACALEEIDAIEIKRGE